MNDLRSLSNKELVEKTLILAREERRITLELLKYLKVIEEKRIYLDLAYDSMFAFLTGELKYCEGSAYRRLKALRVFKEIPEIEGKIADGRLNLTNLSKAQGLFESQKKLDKPLGLNEKKDFLENLENKSTREVEKEILKIQPVVVPKEDLRQVSESKKQLKVILDEELQKDLSELKSLLSHTHPNMSYQDLIKFMAKETLKVLRKKKGIESPPAEEKACVKVSAEKMVEKETDFSKRYIPKNIQRQVWQRDGLSCTETNATTGKKCGSTFQLVLDHRHPWAMGGEHSTENLRVVCAKHNFHKAIKDYGEKKISSFYDG